MTEHLSIRQRNPKIDSVRHYSVDGVKIRLMAYNIFN